MELAAAEQKGQGMDAECEAACGGHPEQNKLFGLNTSPSCTALMKSAFARLLSVATPLASDSRKAGEGWKEGMMQILFAALRQVIALLQRPALDVPTPAGVHRP
jgi:hypothetical protein